MHGSVTILNDMKEIEDTYKALQQKIKEQEDEINRLRSIEKTAIPFPVPTHISPLLSSAMLYTSLLGRVPFPSSVVIFFVLVLSGAANVPLS